MNYIENIYICLAAPLLIALVCSPREYRRIIVFMLGGMTACLLSSYISTFLALQQGMDTVNASINISPIVEETMKILLVLFYLGVFVPGNKMTTEAIFTIAIGFATFENACYLTQNGAERLTFLLIRGFGTGAMHIVCGLLVAIGLVRLSKHRWIGPAGMAGLYALAITFHGIYNLLVSQDSMSIAMVGYLIPLVTIALVFVFGRKAWRAW